MNKLNSKQVNGKENLKKYFLLKSIFFLLIPVLLIFSAWFLTTLPRYDQFKKRYVHLNNKPFFTNYTVLPDTIKGVTKMPDFSGIEWHKISPEVDSNGIAVRDFDTLSIRGVMGKQKCLLGITSFGQKNLNIFFKTNHYENMLLGLRQIDYLVKVFKTVYINNEEIGFWEENFDLGYQYQVKAPWRSAYYQASCLLTILNAYQILHDSKYLDIFKKGLKAYKYDVKEGGLSYRTPNGGLFFEEVASLPYHHILNGHMFTLILINEFMRFSDSKELKNIFNLGLQGLIEMLPNYDRFGYSLYSLSPKPGIINHFNISSPAYHYQHIRELKTLVKITGSKLLNSYAEKWNGKTSGAFEQLWFALYTMFKDTIYAIKFIKRSI